MGKFCHPTIVRATLAPRAPKGFHACNSLWMARVITNMQLQVPEASLKRRRGEGSTKKMYEVGRRCMRLEQTPHVQSECQSTIGERSGFLFLPLFPREAYRRATANFAVGGFNELSQHDAVSIGHRRVEEDNSAGKRGRKRRYYREEEDEEIG